jgi:transposase-like protein
MGRNSKFSKEEKIEICKAYKTGKGSFGSLAKNIVQPFWC